MPYNGEGVQALVCALDDMKNSNLIYVEKCLPRVLKCLAYYEEFKQALLYCNQGFDYPTEMNKACMLINGEYVFRLPSANKNIVALVSNLLIGFDREPTSVITFIDMFYPAASKQESFDFFIKGVIEPFKLSLVDLVVNGIDEEPKIVERTVEFASPGIQQQTEYLVTQMCNTIKVANIDDDLRSELLTMLEGFAIALDSRDSLIIRAIWYGLRGALVLVKLCKTEIPQINETLRMYLISK